MIALLLLLQIAPVSRTYWPVTIAKLWSGTNTRTHVALTGVVAYTRLEADSDFHVKLVADTAAVRDTAAAFVIVEMIPAIPLPHPKVRSRITVYGIYRRDPEHRNWPEVHPCERWTLTP